MPLLNAAAALYLGDVTVERVYLGDEQVWPKPPPTWHRTISAPVDYPPELANLAHGTIAVRDHPTAGLTHMYVSWFDAAGTDQQADITAHFTRGATLTFVAGADSYPFTIAAINDHYDGGILVTDPTDPAARRAWFAAHQGQRIRIEQTG